MSSPLHAARSTPCVRSARRALSCLAALALACASARGQGADESAYYAVDYLTPPDGARLEVGGMAFFPDGRLAVSTRRGPVWMVENALAADPAAARFSLFAEGLQEGLGLCIEGERLFVLQRAELSELVDLDRDGRCDEIRTVANDWGVSGHYHEFAFGLPRDARGNFFISLNVSFGDPQWWHGRSTAPWRGWVLRLSPDGRTTPFASGLRSPCGLGMNAEGDLFATDNQGDWMPACPIFHVVEGGFYGHPASLNWTEEYRAVKRIASDTIPPTTPRRPAAIWIPYDWSRSAGNLVPDPAGKLGPFQGQLFVAELTNGVVLRAQLEKVRGEYQGAVIPFRRGVGSAVRTVFAPDGTLFTGFTDRGWGGQAPGDGIGRIRATGRAPLEIRTVHLVDDGFEVEFTQPLAAAPAPERVRILQYDYDYWWEYGSPARHLTEVSAQRVVLDPDGKRLKLTAAVRPGMCARVRFDGLVSRTGEPLLHDEFAYTVNQLPSGPPCTELVAKQAPPPPPKERSAEGMLELSWPDALDSWKQSGWSAQRSGVAMDPTDRKRLVAHGELESWERSAVLRNEAAGGAEPTDLVSRFEFGDVEAHVDFLLPEGGNSGVYLMGRYEVQLLDSSGKTSLGFGDCGGIYLAWGEGAEWLGRAPMFNAFRGPGQWHGLTVRFRAPRFDASGKKIANARFERVMIDDVLLHENVEVPEPTRGALAEPREVPFGPLRLQGDHGPVAFKNVWVRPLRPSAEAPQSAVADAIALDLGPAAAAGSAESAAWSVPGEGRLEAGAGAPERTLRGAGGVALELTDARFSFEARLGKGLAAAVHLRDGGAGAPGYGLALATAADGEQAGSLLGLAPVRAQLVPEDLWCRFEFEVRDEPGGVRVRSFVNGVLVGDALDPERRRKSGGLRFTGLVGGRLELRNLKLERLGR